jgi:1,4-dihydroxy-2-naphthoate octaprenyltransferase
LSVDLSVLLGIRHLRIVCADQLNNCRVQVRLGAAGGLQALQLGVAAAYLLLVTGVACGLVPAPAAALAVVGSLPAATELLAFASTNYAASERIAPLKRYACMWHIAYGISLAMGLAVARWLLTNDCLAFARGWH